MGFCKPQMRPLIKLVIGTRRPYTCGVYSHVMKFRNPEKKNWRCQPASKYMMYNGHSAGMSKHTNQLIDSNPVITAKGARCPSLPAKIPKTGMTLEPIKAWDMLNKVICQATSSGGLPKSSRTWFFHCSSVLKNPIRHRLNQICAAKNVAKHMKEMLEAAFKTPRQETREGGGEGDPGLSEFAECKTILPLVKLKVSPIWMKRVGQSHMDIAKSKTNSAVYIKNRACLETPALYSA
mmetsp:Transcript_22140/g.48418  ORF Transcript_22140/g.48418 Transcript_22140/m.48418 type:complete len:236 (+) Transcript_22140:712-1419(+)